MSPVAFVLLVVGFDRLLSSCRVPTIRRAQPWWLRARPRLVPFVRSAPATYTYLAILFVTTWVLASASVRLADRLLLAESTNLHHLARDPLRVLIGSAFWLSGTRDLAIAACVFTVVLAPLERRIGAWRTAGVFAIGHVGATLLTAAGLGEPWVHAWLFAGARPGIGDGCGARALDWRSQSRRPRTREQSADGRSSVDQMLRRAVHSVIGGNRSGRGTSPEFGWPGAGPFRGASAAAFLFCVRAVAAPCLTQKGGATARLARPLVAAMQLPPRHAMS
jgi:hypothetical protein